MLHDVTCEKDVGMGLYTFNSVIMLSLHLSVLFGTSIPTSFYIFGRKKFVLVSVRFFIKYINIMHASITVELATKINNLQLSSWGCQYSTQ